MALAGSNRKPALTAAASKIAFSRVTADKLKDETWQERAWGVYDKLPAVFYMTRYRSDVASKIDYYVAVAGEPGEDPDVDEDGPGSKVLEAEGGPELLRRVVSELVVHWDIPGEGYLTRFDEAPFWRVLSTQELKKQGNKFIWGDELNQMGTIEADQVYRVWDPHPRFHWQADSPVRHILEEAEELILLSRSAKVQSMSQIAAGILMLPDTVDLSPFAEDESGTEDDVARWLVEVLSKPITDPGSTASVVPAVMTMNGDDIAKARHMTFARDWTINLELRRELLASVATGLDLPPEILTGMADLNHWSAWLVSEQAVNQHVLPSVDAILDSLTSNWFRPLLEANSLDPDAYVLWRDPSPATVSPDQSDVAIRLYEIDAISGEATRRVTNFDEEDAPTPEELEEKTARRSQSTQGVPTDGPPIQAATGPSFTADVPARIDSDLLAWVVEAAHTEIERLLVLIEDAALTSAADPLDESLLDSFADRLANRITQAQARVKKWLKNLTGAEVNIPGQEVAAAAGVAAVVKAVLDAVRARLFTPQGSPDPIDLGEIPEVAVPIKQIRDGLSLAGGGLPLFEGDKAWELIGNGKDAFDVLDARGFRTLSYRWDYGLMPRITEFPAHKALDQHTFPSWESADLTVHSENSWLRRPYYKPGDHAGCGCSYVRVLTVSLPVPIAASV